ncbi:hypothetical protein ACOME3_005757 [Neoechinorhynchus agilis]
MKTDECTDYRVDLAKNKNDELDVLFPTDSFRDLIALKIDLLVTKKSTPPSIPLLKNPQRSMLNVHLESSLRIQSGQRSFFKLKIIKIIYSFFIVTECNLWLR